MNRAAAAEEARAGLELRNTELKKEIQKQLSAVESTEWKLKASQEKWKEAMQTVDRKNVEIGLIMRRVEASEARASELQRERDRLQVALEQKTGRIKKLEQQDSHHPRV